tara:strand:- start:12157 stop:14073 length:1917 start_codon:yes stop_codon:yes gene_type:complete
VQQKIKYRSEIDGLRAIAVIGVILYHSEIYVDGNLLFSGGFLGVDVFFVISGYLITSIILKEHLVKNNFSLLGFYERRIRRLVPALLFVLITSLILAYFLLLPIEFKSFLNSILSSIFFYSNLYFHYSGEAYGQTILSDQPLLHTWSLSVEEQFYILYPILFIFLLGVFKDKIKFLFYLFIITSVIFSSYISESHSSFNFYMITNRAWELACGALISINHFHNKKKENNNFWKILGFVLIIFSFFFFDSANNHPSYLTLIPVLGCCMIINNYNNDNFIDKILKNKFFVKIGLISYSLYLWHHPILSFGKISGFTENSLLAKFILILISFLLSILTYNYIEKYFRDPDKISFKKLAIIILPSVFSSFLILNVLVEKQKNKYPNILKNLYERTWFTTKQYYKPCFQRKKYFCFFGNTNNKHTVFLVGDSVLASIQEELKNSLVKRKINFIPMTNAGCDFYNKQKQNKFCNNNIQLNRDRKIRELKESIIIMHINYRTVDNDTNKIRSFIDNINKYLDLGYKIIVINPIPQWNQNVSQVIHNIYKDNKKNFLEELNQKSAISLEYYDYSAQISKIISKFNDLSHKNLFFINPVNIFCNIEEKNKCLANSQENIYFTDASHLSKVGSKMINSELIKLIEKIK